MRHVATIGVMLALAGCSTAVETPRQLVTVVTRFGDQDVAGARCTLTNNRGQWLLVTPGSAMVHRSLGDLMVRCSRDGYIANAGSAPAETSQFGWANIATLGLGEGIDLATGSAFGYPPLLVLHLQPIAQMAPGS